MFIDPTSMTLIAAPMFAPIMIGLGFDSLWFGLLFMVLLQIAYISPPFGWSLFFVAGSSSPPVKLSAVYRSSIPFVGLQLIGLTIFIVWPQSMLWLPSLLFK
jgi:TRAP-type mannitol/chloroaromatic compound transport system permease large subunit